MNKFFIGLTISCATIFAAGTGKGLSGETFYVVNGCNMKADYQLDKETREMAKKTTGAESEKTLATPLNMITCLKYQMEKMKTVMSENGAKVYYFPDMPNVDFLLFTSKYKNKDGSVKSLAIDWSEWKQNYVTDEKGNKYYKVFTEKDETMNIEQPLSSKELGYTPNKK